MSPVIPLQVEYTYRVADVGNLAYRSLLSALRSRRNAAGSGATPRRTRPTGPFANSKSLRKCAFAVFCSQSQLTAQHRFAQQIRRMARSFPVREAGLIAVKLQRR